MEGRQVGLALQVDGQHFTDDCLVTSIKQLLPKDPKVGRDKDLIQFFTDRGERVVAVASLRPYQRRKRRPKAEATADEDE